MLKTPWVNKFIPKHVVILSIFSINSSSSTVHSHIFHKYGTTFNIVSYKNFGSLVNI